MQKDRKDLVNNVVIKFGELIRASSKDESETIMLIPPAQYDALGDALLLLAKAEEPYVSESDIGKKLAEGKWVIPSALPQKLLLERQLMSKEQQEEERFVDCIDQFYPLIFSRALGFGYRIEPNSNIYYARLEDLISVFENLAEIFEI